MRWEGLFADLEGRLAAEERRDLDDEVAERTRRERALVDARRPARAPRRGRRCGSGSSRGIRRATASCSTSATAGCWCGRARRAREVLVPTACGRRSRTARP